MRNRATRRETCRLCGHALLDEALRLVPTPEGNEFLLPSQLDREQPAIPLTIMLCARCGHAQLQDIVNPESIYKDRTYIYATSVSLGLTEHFDAYAAEFLERHQISGGLAVELGSNEGATLAAFRKRGMAVLGVDPAPDLARRANAAGLETLPTYFTADLARKIRQERGPARIVIANNVFANIDDLVDVAAGIRELLALDGLFVFESSYFLDVVEQVLLDTIFHEHLSYFSVKPLEAFFRTQGLELIHVQRTAPKGGSIRGTVQRAGGLRPVDASVAAIIDLETDAGLFQLATYRDLEARLDALKADLDQLLDTVTAGGGTVAAYGAAVGLVTLIYHFGLGSRISFIVDDYPDKQGTFSPGLRIPVLAPTALLERKPAAVVLLAWRYQQAILQKNPAYVAQGGRFILPLPRVGYLT